MPKFELHKVGFVNPLDLSETVVLSTILDGVGGATRSFVEEEPETFVLEDGQDIHDGQIFTFSMAGLPNADTAQIYTWISNRTKLTIVGYSYKDFLLMENVVITRLVDSSMRIAWKLGAKKAGTIGYKNAKLGTETMMGENLFNMYFFEVGSTATIAGGWSKTGGTSSFAGGAQTFSTTGVSAVHFQRDIPFPFPEQLTARINVTTTPTVGTGIALEIGAFDNTGTIIGTFESLAITTSGVKSVTKTMPSNTEFVRVRVKVGQNDSITFNEPALNKGTSTNFTSQ